MTAGFVYRDGDAFAIYHATLHHHDHASRVDLAIGLGKWQGDDAVADVSAFLAVWGAGDEIQFGFVEPGESAWSTARLLQNQLKPDHARTSTARSDLIQVAEFIVRSDAAVATHLA